VRRYTKAFPILVVLNIVDGYFGHRPSIRNNLKDEGKRKVRSLIFEEGRRVLGDENGKHRPTTSCIFSHTNYRSLLPKKNPPPDNTKINAAK
jgi:hypothetical protein